MSTKLFLCVMSITGNDDRLQRDLNDGRPGTHRMREESRPSHLFFFAVPDECHTLFTTIISHAFPPRRCTTDVSTYRPTRSDFVAITLKLRVVLL